jgi:HEAT repeat protein
MCIRKINVALCSICVIAGVAASQDNPPKVITPGPPISLAEQLKQRRVEMTRSGLLKALRSSDEQVRYLAALRLAEEKQMDTIPAIEEALSIERVPETRINIAVALLQLGQEKGIAELSTACEESGLPGYLRVRAMTYLFPLGKKACFRAALDMLRTDPDSRDQILSLLPRYRPSSKEESDEVLEATARCLSDESGAVRIQASITLSTLANPVAIRYLQSAIAVEQDDVVRSQMQVSLERLQGKPPK